MGADCCGGKKSLPTPALAPDSCDDKPVSECNKNVVCCTPGNEKCNEECLKYVAATLCTEGVGHHTDGHKDCCARNESDELDTFACEAHLQMAFAQYQSFLDNVRCICRSMIDRGYKSCCRTADTEVTTGAAVQGFDVAHPGPSACQSGQEDCCKLSTQSAAAGDENGGSIGKTEDQRRRQVNRACKSKSMSCCESGENIESRFTGKKQVDDCCGNERLSCKKKPENDYREPTLDNCCSTQKRSTDDCKDNLGASGCCSDEKGSACSGDDGPLAGYRDACCGKEGNLIQNSCCDTVKQCQPIISPAETRNASQDIDKDNSDEVRINVTGMTCNGCSDNLARNLAANGAHNIRINYLQGHADFTINPSRDLDAILAKTQDATGFHITKVDSKVSITVLTSDAVTSTALTRISLDGVGEVVLLNKNTVRIQYNPAIIGARELFHKIGHLSVGLAPPQNYQQLASGRKRFLTLLIQTTASFVLTIPILVLTWGETRVNEHTEAIISLVLGTLVQFLAVPVFYKPALQSLINHGVLELDMLVVVAITVAFTYSVTAFGYLMAGAPLESGPIFETSSLLISLIMLGRLVASYSRIRAVAAVSVRSLQVATAVIVENGMECEIDARLLQFGDTFKVLPHSRIPTDGAVISGASEVDESMVTGESLPINKQSGSLVIAGTTNGSGTLLVRLTRLPGENTITDIAKLVEDASSSQPRIQETADRVASWFLPTVLAIAVAVFVIWTVVNNKVRNRSGGTSVATAITYAVAVLAVSCPCGIGLAVPLVLVVANGIAARGGVVVKSSQCTERSRKTTDVIFDKTGTLTEPDLDVVTEAFFNHDVSDARAIIKALIGDNQHPVSVAIAKHLGPEVLSSPLVINVQSIPGSGVEATMSGTVLRAGHAKWAGGETLPEVRKMLEDGMSILVVTRDSMPIACYGLQARLRTDAVATVAKLRETGITVHLVSGDHNWAVQAVAAAVGIDRANVSSQQSPQEKQAYVAALMALPGRVVMFCGDGTNDAVAVTQADIGVQLSDALACEITRGAADVVLLSGLSGIPFLIEVSHAAFTRIMFNFVWSAIYNVFSILLAAGAFVRVRIPPAYAGAGELVSLLPIIVASLTMLLLKLRPA